MCYVKIISVDGEHWLLYENVRAHENQFLKIIILCTLPFIFGLIRISTRFENPKYLKLLAMYIQDFKHTTSKAKRKEYRKIKYLYNAKVLKLKSKSHSFLPIFPPLDYIFQPVKLVRTVIAAEEMPISVRRSLIEF